MRKLKKHRVLSSLAFDYSYKLLIVCDNHFLAEDHISKKITLVGYKKVKGYYSVDTEVEEKAFDSIDEAKVYMEKNIKGCFDDTV